MKDSTKKIFIYVTVLVAIVFIITKVMSIKAEAHLITYPGSDEVAWGEDSRQLWYDKYHLNSYKDYGVKDNLDQIKYGIDKLAIEYEILDETISITDYEIFVNEDCGDRILVDLFIGYVLDAKECTGDINPDADFPEDAMPNKVYNINSLINMFNSEEEIYDNYQFWWYSLGPNRSKYTYIINDINYLTDFVNKRIDIQNKIDPYNQIDHVEYIKPYEYKEKYKDWWDGMKLFNKDLAWQG